MKYFAVFFFPTSLQDWQPPFAVNVETFRFTPRIQKLNELEVSIFQNLFTMKQDVDILPCIVLNLFHLYILPGFIDKHNPECFYFILFCGKQLL